MTSYDEENVPSGPKSCSTDPKDVDDLQTCLSREFTSSAELLLHQNSNQAVKMEFPDGQRDLPVGIRLHHDLISRIPDEGEVIRDRQLRGNNTLHDAVLFSDVDACLQESQNLNVNDVNAFGETPLHLAAMNRTREGVNLIGILLAEGGDVNKQNMWGQTPIHYAAITDSFENLQRLTAVLNVDVSIVDLNGYNALHCLVSYREAPSLVVSSDFDDDVKEDVSDDLKNALCQLVKMGTNLNCQTSFGHSILHLAATRNDNTPLLRFFLQQFPELDLRTKNQMGENFLHVYAKSEIFEEVSAMLDEIAETSLPVLKDVLADKNVLGRTPWCDMIDDANISEDVVQKVLSYGVPANTADNLGNTALHRIAGVSVGIFYSGIIDLLIQGGADVNAENVYNESPGFVLFLIPVFDVFKKRKMDFSKTDRWSRSPLVSIMKHRPMPDLLRRLMQECTAEINIKDMYGSTPLHFAAYHDYPEQVELLLERGADKNAIDDLRDRPLDTARRHCSFQCHRILSEHEVGAFPRIQVFEQILLDMPRVIPLSRITSSHAVQQFLGLEENFDGLIGYLLSRNYRRPAEVAKEVEVVTAEVNALVEKLCAKIAKYDSRFQMSVFPTGSSAEGTKVGRPDEFDFVLCLDQLVDKTDILMTEKCLETGYACLRFKETPVSKDYRPFSDSDGYFLALPFLQHLSRFLKRALNETNLWQAGNMYYNFEDKVKVLNDKPVFNFSVYWIGSIFKQLKVSIDLVPGVYKRGWWPPNINTKEIPLANESVIDAGCFLMLQTTAQDFEKKRHLLNDSISHTCNTLKNETDFVQRRMLRVSATPAEISLMRSLPEKFRHAYALAKIMKSEDVCPQIEIDMLPTSRYLILKKFEEKKALPVKPSVVIKSYMLKTCTFYVFQEMHRCSKRSYSELNVAQIAAKACEYLLQFSDEKCLKPYFLPFSEVFKFENDKSTSFYTDFMLQLKREFSLKLMLGFLNKPFPEICLASKTEKCH